MTSRGESRGEVLPNKKVALKRDYASRGERGETKSHSALIARAWGTEWRSFHPLHPSKRKGRS
jgi:hypothetical protein